MLDVSVIVVSYNERENIDQCLSSLIRQRYPGKNYEIICVDNGSDDGTQKIILDYGRQFSKLRLIDNPVRGIAGSRNLGIMNAAYDMVAFIDADCEAPEDWIMELVRGYEKYSPQVSRLAAVGGSNLAPSFHSEFYNVLAIFLNTYFGSHGSVQGMHFNNDRSVSHLPTVNILYSKKALLSVGGFDVTLANIGEDQDISYRLLDRGYSFYYLSRPAVLHRLRPDYTSWFRNMFVYGKGRMWLMRKFPRRIEPVLLLPALLILSMAVSLVTRRGIFFLLPLLYIIAIFIISVFECKKANKLEYFLRLFYLYVGSHCAYGLGQWYGLVRNRDFYRCRTQKHLMIAVQNENTQNFEK